MIKTTTEAGTSAKYVTTLTGIPASNFKMSTTEKNTAFFDVDLRSVLSGSYSVIVEYQIVPVRSMKRLLKQVEEELEISKSPEIKKESQKVPDEDFAGFTGNVSSFKLEYQSNFSNFGIKMSTIFGIMIILVLGMI